jgi:hypothetical protein
MDEIARSHTYGQVHVNFVLQMIGRIPHVQVEEEELVEVEEVKRVRAESPEFIKLMTNATRK